MELKKTLLSLAVAFSFGTPIFAQAQKMSEVCGTTDQDILIERLSYNREMMKLGLIKDESRGAKKYIPVKFHIIAKNDQSGRVNEAKILEVLCQINKDYADQDFVFYLKTEANGDIFNYINNDNAYTNQSNALGISTLNTQFKKFPNAINVFIAQSLTSQNQLGGTTLGYYSPTNDWLVMRNDQINATSGTLSHELGHHFSLPHPFKGWDQQTCKDIYPTDWASGKEFQVTILKAPDGLTNVEFADGSNCNNAGDNICDTPADYNFGFDWNGCTDFTKKIKDPKGGYLNPEEKLFMGYFIGCANYIFTTQQKAAILADYLSAKRAKIRPNYTPNIVDVTASPTLLFPANNAQTEYYNSITLDWEDVPGADHYVIEVDKTSSFSSAPQRFVEKSSMKVITNLQAGTSYYWRVTPFHSETGSCLLAAAMPKNKFTTSSVGVSTRDITNVADWSVAPNPVASGTSINVDVEVATPFEAEIALINSVGQKVISVGNQQFTQGTNRVEIPTGNLASGIYNVSMRTNAAVLVKKIVVIK